MNQSDNERLDTFQRITRAYLQSLASGEALDFDTLPQTHPDLAERGLRRALVVDEGAAGREMDSSRACEHEAAAGIPADRRRASARLPLDAGRWARGMASAPRIDRCTRFSSDPPPVSAALPPRDNAVR